MAITLALIELERQIWAQKKQNNVPHNAVTSVLTKKCKQICGFRKNPIFGPKMELWVILKFSYILVCSVFTPLHRQTFSRHFEPKITFLAQLEPKLWPIIYFPHSLPW